MAKLTTTDVTTLTNESSAMAAINANNAAIETALENTLSRDGTSPNQMEAVLDMNSQQIINLPAPLTGSSPLRYSDLVSFVGGGTVTNIPSGGGTGDILSKTSATDYDVSWATAASQPISTATQAALDIHTAEIAAHTLSIASKVSSSILTTRGDIFVRGASDIGRLAASTSGYHLQAAGAGADPAWSGFLQAGTGAVTRTWQDKARDFLNVKDFGATGDGTTNDYAAIVLARTAAIAAGVSLGFPDGTYAIGSTLELGYEKLKIIALGSKVTIKHTGTGVGVSFNGITNYPGTQGAAGVVFGGPNRFLIEGNANTTNLVLVDNLHFSDVKFAGKNATNAILLLQDTGTVAIASAVETTFDVLITPNASGTFTTTPLYGIHATRAAACIFERPIIEVVGSAATAGVHLVNCVGNVFRQGTIESCNGGGINIDSTSSRNTFIGMHNEVNGALQDWIVAGDHNIFIGCAGAGTTAGQTVSGDRNLFIAGKWQSLTVTAAGSGNWFENCQFLTAFTDSGANTTVINPDSLAQAALKLPASDIFLDANQALRIGTSTDNVVSGDGSTFVRFGTSTARAARVIAGTSEWKLYASGGMTNGATDRGAGTLDVTGAVYDNGTAPTGTAGSGYVRKTSPSLTTPSLGAATASSLNISGALTTGTDGSSFTFGPGGSSALNSSFILEGSSGTGVGARFLFKRNGTPKWGLGDEAALTGAGTSADFLVYNYNTSTSTFHIDNTTDLVTLGGGLSLATPLGEASGGTGKSSLAWTTPTFAAGDFTANGAMTWTVASGDVTTYRYLVIGKTMHLVFVITTTTVGGTPNIYLYVKIPGGYTAANRTLNATGLINDNGTLTTGSVDTVAAGSTVVRIFKTGVANWTAATDATSVYGSLTFEVQ